jgi:predicted transcriptional regulator
MMIKKEAEERQSQGRREGGRGHKKTLPTNVDKVSESRQRHARSTEGQIATLTKTSRRTVSETIRVLDHGSPELVQQLKQEEISAHNAVKKLSPKKQANKPTKKLTRALQIEVSLKSQIEFLERIRAQAFTRLKEAEAIGKRSWNIENSSKVALARGLNEIRNARNASVTFECY